MGLVVRKLRGDAFRYQLLDRMIELRRCRRHEPQRGTHLANSVAQVGIHDSWSSNNCFVVESVPKQVK